ncbi:MAG: hypothetical protein JWN72_1188 [Thermoleophilia bacterium]|nr:hypothetical protein [Thermoleophilia bacterium]
MAMVEGHPDPERTRAAALRFKHAWELNWAAGTLRGVLPLYAEHAIFRTYPHREADVGHEAIGLVFDTFESVATNVTCVFGEPLIDGAWAVFEWWASWTEDGTGMSMAGMSKVAFDDEGLVVESRDYWNTADSATRPYDGW